MPSGRTPKTTNKWTPTAPIGPPPDWLPEQAADLYRVVAEEAGELLCSLDTYGLGMWATCYVRHRQAEEVVEQNGLLVGGALNPAVRVSSDMLRQCLRFQDQLGLSPLARGRIQAERLKVGEDDFGKLLKKVETR